MLHVRDMVPPAPEEVAETVTEIVETSEPVYERDPATGVLIRTGDEVTTSRAVIRETGRIVKGNVQQRDLTCRDCGAGLKPMDDRGFYYLACARLAIPGVTSGETSRRMPHFVDGKTVWKSVPAEQPYPESVLECGGWRP